MPNNSQLASPEPQGYKDVSRGREKAGPSNLTNCTLRDATLGNPRAEKTVANDVNALAPGVRTLVSSGQLF